LRHSNVLLLMLVFVSGLTFAADKTAVSVPIKLDYSLLRQLLIEQLFTGPNQSRTVHKNADSCNRVVLTDPRIAPQKANLEIHAQVSAQLGMKLFGECKKMLSWSGSVGFLGLPVIKSGGVSMGLEPQALWLVRANGDRITSGRMWDYAQDPLEDLFGSFTIDLTPYTLALGAFLPDVLPDQSATQLQDTLDSLKLANLRVASVGLLASIDFTVDALAERLPAEEELSPEELQEFESRWQTMDALLVFAVKHYAAATHLEDLRSALLDILIDSRYQLVDALAAPPDQSNDLVRVWFLDTWQRLNPVVRSIALKQAGGESLRWMSVLAATDALYAMDQLGSQIGFEFSVNGLRRLARMINQGVEPDELIYDDAVDPELQQLFQEQIQLEAVMPSAWNVTFSLMSRAYAQTSDDELNLWVPDVRDMGDYLPRVSKLLDDSADAVLQRHNLDKNFFELYRKLVLATAWQESCWRQFIVQDGQIQPLISSTGDVGLMQMNERVWRGFYDLQKLRWNIAYNSNAGSEVLLDYLIKYAIRRNEHKESGGLDNLARASYSAYNGGPSKASRYRKADVSPYHRKIDMAFWKKYQWISAGDQGGIARCLGAKT
jgi:hypothetical protein